MPYDIGKLIPLLPPYPPEMERDYARLKTNFQRLLFILRGGRTGAAFQQVTGIPSPTLARWESEDNVADRGNPYPETLVKLAAYAHPIRKWATWEVEFKQGIDREKAEKRLALRAVLEGGEKHQTSSWPEEKLISVADLLDIAYSYEGAGTHLGAALSALSTSYREVMARFEEERARTTFYQILDGFYRDTEIHLDVGRAHTPEDIFERASTLPPTEGMKFVSMTVAYLEVAISKNLPRIGDATPVEF